MFAPDDPELQKDRLLEAYQTQVITLDQFTEQIKKVERQKPSIHVQLIQHPSELFKLKDTVQVMAQWRGEWRSDFFQFTVGQAREFIQMSDSHGAEKIRTQLSVMNER